MIKYMICMLALFSSMCIAQLLQPRLVVQQSSYDFGDVIQGESVSHTFVLSNSGGDLLKITNIQAGCGCTAADPDKSELAPGESTNLTVKFNTAGRMGKQTKTVKVFTNDPQNSEITLVFTANIVLGSEYSEGVPVIHFPETQHNFGKLTEGDKVDYTFRFKNTGSVALKIKDIKTSCGCTAALLSKNVLAPGEEGTLQVELDTKNRSGRMSRTITINSNDPATPAKVLTIYADIEKKGS